MITIGWRWGAFLHLQASWRAWCIFRYYIYNAIANNVRSCWGQIIWAWCSYKVKTSFYYVLSLRSSLSSNAVLLILRTWGIIYERTYSINVLYKCYNATDNITSDRCAACDKCVLSNHECNPLPHKDHFRPAPRKYSETPFLVYSAFKVLLCEFRSPAS